MGPHSALILGGAACVWEDAAAAFELFTPDILAAVNNAGLDYEGHVDHWFSLHVEQSKDWMGLRCAVYARKAHGRNRPTLWSGSPHSFIDVYVDDCWCSADGGDSGLMAVQGLLAIGVRRIVLAGVPVTPTGHYFDTRPWGAALDARQHWEKHASDMRPYVKSMSGFTRELLGPP